MIFLEESAWNSPSPTLGVEIKLTDYMSTGAGWRGVVPKSAKLTVSPYDADTGNLLPALLGGSVRLTVDLGMITSVKLGSCIPEPNLDCGRIKPNYATGSLSPLAGQQGNLLDGAVVTIHVHQSGVEIFSQQGRKFYGTSCVGDVVLTQV